MPLAAPKSKYPIDSMASHEPVLLDEILGAMAGTLEDGETREGRFLDGTFGGGGHTEGLLSLNHAVEVVALDRDPEAAERAHELEEEYGDRFAFIDLNFAELGKLEVRGFNGALFDLGVSSYQLDDGERGFSFRSEAYLDMRMDPRRGMSAAEFLEQAPEADLIRAIRDYGEEPSWRRVVRALLKHRGTGKLQNTLSLATLIEETLGPKSRYGRPQRIHPATRSFQGIRIAVNAELEALEAMLPVAFEMLKPGGVLAVISFHSLEDRIVKRFTRRMAGRPEHGWDQRTQDQRTVQGQMLGSKAIRPSPAEVERNPRSRSARLRLIEKLKKPLKDT